MRDRSPARRSVGFDNTDSVNHGVSILSRHLENDLNVFVTARDPSDEFTRVGPLAARVTVQLEGRAGDGFARGQDSALIVFRLVGREDEEQNLPAAAAGAAVEVP